MKRFNSKAVIITGADSSLGRSTALMMAKEGANVILLGTNDKVLQYIADELPEDHTWINTGNHLTVTCDITNEQQGEKLVTYILNKYHKIDCLININTDVKTSKAMLSELNKSKGNIINASLLSDTNEDWTFENYKEAVTQLEESTKQLALQHSDTGIRVNGVCAGLTTEDSDDIDNVQAVLKQSPLGELIEMNEIAEAILFLASHHARLLTGTTLVVDGGLSLTL